MTLELHVLNVHRHDLTCISMQVSNAFQLNEPPHLITPTLIVVERGRQCIGHGASSAYKRTFRSPMTRCASALIGVRSRHRSGHNPQRNTDNANAYFWKSVSACSELQIRTVTWPFNGDCMYTHHLIHPYMLQNKVVITGAAVGYDLEPRAQSGFQACEW